MNRKAEINARLKQLAGEMDANLGITGEARTEEVEQQYLAAEREADELTLERAKIEADEAEEARRQKVAAIHGAATGSTRLTRPGQPHIGRIKESIQDDPKRGFKCFAEFAQTVYDSGNTPRQNDRIMQIAAGTGMTQSVNNDGGVLVPPAFSRAIWDRVRTRSNSLLAYCNQISVDPGVESVTIPALAESSRADGSRQGGIRGYWKSELSLMNSSQQKFREVKLTPHELYVFCFISDKLLRNAPQTASQMMEQGAADEISFKIGDAIINGDGLGKPTGILGHPATVSVAKETGQAAASLVPENISKMWARCHTNWRAGAVWFINADVETAMRNMKFEIGTGGVPVFLPPGGLSETPYSTLYGRPVVPIEYCATLGTVGDIILANLQSYAAAIKGMVDTAYSMHLKFDYAQTAYRVIFEVDGQPWLNSPITPFKGSNTTSPIVTLATRA